MVDVVKYGREDELCSCELAQEAEEEDESSETSLTPEEMERVETLELASKSTQVDTEPNQETVGEARPVCGYETSARV